MNRLSLLLLGTTVACGAVSLVLYQALLEERNRVRTLEARVAGIEATRETAVARAEDTRPPSAPQPDRAKKAPAAVTQSASANAKTATSGTGPDAENYQEQYRRQLADPKFRASQIAWHRMQLEDQYPDLAAQMNLRPEDANRLLDLLAEHQIEESIDATIGPNEQPDAAWMAEQQRRSEERQRKLDADLAALLGEDGRRKWKDYQASLPVRAQLRELRLALAGSDAPLRNDQFESLVAAITAEQQRHWAERTELRAATTERGQPTPAELAAYMEQRLALIEESLQRRRDAAAVYLGPEQQRRFDELLDRELRRAQIEMQSWVASAKLEARKGP